MTEEKKEEKINKKIEELELKYYNDNFQILLRDIKSRETYTHEQNLEMLKKYAEEEDEIKKIAIKNNIVEHNLKLVLYFSNRFITDSVSIEDIMQEGTIGLMKSIENFDLTKNLQFSTFASYYIKGNIMNNIEDIKKNIRIPRYLINNMSKINKLQKEYIKKNGKEPSIFELAKLSDFSEKKVYELLKKIDENIGNTTSLNDNVNEVNKSEIINLIESTEKSIETKCIEKDESIKLVEVLSTMKIKPNHLEMLKYKYGFYNNRVYSYEEIALMYNLSKQRIYQILSVVLEKMGKSEEFKIFDPAYEEELITKKNKNKIKENLKKYKPRRENKPIYNEDQVINKNYEECLTIYEEYENKDRTSLDIVIKKTYLDHEDKYLLKYGPDLNVKNYCDTKSEEYILNDRRLKQIIYKNLISYETNPKKYLSRGKSLLEKKEILFNQIEKIDTINIDFVENNNEENMIINQTNYVEKNTEISNNYYYGEDYILNNLISTLEPIEQKIAILSCCQDETSEMSYLKIAKILNVSESYVALIMRKVLILYNAKKEEKEEILIKK